MCELSDAFFSSNARSAYPSNNQFVFTQNVNGNDQIACKWNDADPRGYPVSGYRVSIETYDWDRNINNVNNVYDRWENIAPYC
jgi:hypothetical protein